MKCFATGFAIYAPAIKPGKYGIDFTGSNDTGWREMLTISESENEIIEEMVITKDGVGEIKKRQLAQIKIMTAMSGSKNNQYRNVPIAGRFNAIARDSGTMRGYATRNDSD